MSLVLFLVIVSVTCIYINCFAVSKKLIKVSISTSLILVFLWFVLYDSFSAEHEDLKFSDDFTLVSSISVDIPNGASIYLSSGYSSYIATTDNTFVLTENTTITSLEDFLGSTKKNVYLCVREENKIIYSYDFGICSTEDAVNILEDYKSIVKSNTITTSVYRYRIFGIFYYDKKVVMAGVCE